MTPEQLAERRTQTLGVLGSLADLAASAGLSDLAEELRGTYSRKLASDEVQLVVVGEFNRGKSSVINALLGAEVLKSGITPTTERLQYVSFSETPTERELVDPSRSPIAAGANAVAIGYPAPILKARVTIVDTPGVNDLSEQRAEITYGILPRADAALVVLDGTQALTESERVFLSERVLKGARERLIFAVNKIDRLDARALGEALAFVREHLSKIVADPLVFPISARRRLAAIAEGRALRAAEAGSPDEDGFVALEAQIGHILAEDRPRLVVDHAISGGLRSAAYLREALGIRRRTAELDLGVLEEKVARLHAELEITTRQLRGYEQRIRDECGAAKALVRGDLSEFAGTLAKVLPIEIEGVDPDDCKRYLAPFIEDKLREWVEREGDRLSERMGKLAEEIVALANDDVSRAMDSVARELGPDIGRIDLDVDSLKYDASVFALGAFGTTLLFFARGLAGGLLALAAPIVAAIARAHVGKQIKEQAKTGAPEAVLKAAEVIGPRLDAAIDDFGARLAAFVIEAGLKLRRAVTEVLERALEERRKGEVPVESVRLAVDRDLAAVHELESALRAVRDSLWDSSSA
jgi:small GTP-binding protein